MRKKLKKYTGGGPTPFAQSTEGQALSQFGGMLGQGIQQLDGADGHMSAVGGFGGGALKGAAAGAAFGVPGAIIGGVIGGISGLHKRNQFNDEQAAIEADELAADRLRAVEAERAERAGMNNILAQYPVKGTSTPSFELGGPTGGGEKYHAIPNYGGSMDPNAQPSMDFYFQGQKMPAADFIKQLPEGMNINQVAAYGMDKAQPMFDPQTGWSNVGVNDYMRSFAMSQGNTPTYALGGTTLPQYEAEGGEMIQYKQGDMPAVYGKGGITEVSSQEYEIKGPSHAQGGVDMSDEKGARIYSNKLTVDPELMAKLNNL